MHRCLSRFVPRASLSVRVPPAVPLSVPSCRSAAAASRLTHAHTTKRHNTQTAYNRNDEHDNPSSTATSSSSSSSVVLDADLSSDEDSLLARSYFPFGPPPPTTFPTANDGPLCRVGFGGTPRAGNNASDASAAVSDTPSRECARGEYRYAESTPHACSPHVCASGCCCCFFCLFLVNLTFASVVTSSI